MGLFGKSYQQGEHIANRGKEAIDYLDQLSSEVEKVRKYQEAKVTAKQDRMLAQAERERDAAARRYGVKRVK